MKEIIDRWICWEELQHSLRRGLNELLEKQDLNLNEFYVLYYLNSAKDHKLAITDFQEKIDLSQSALSRLIQHMSSKSCGVIERIPNPDDKRSTLIHLTSSGERILIKAKENVENYLQNKISNQYKIDLGLDKD